MREKEKERENVGERGQSVGGGRHTKKTLILSVRQDIKRRWQGLNLLQEVGAARETNVFPGN